MILWFLVKIAVLVSLWELGLKSSTVGAFPEELLPLRGEKNFKYLFRVLSNIFDEYPRLFYIEVTPPGFAYLPRASYAVMVLKTWLKGHCFLVVCELFSFLMSLLASVKSCKASLTRVAISRWIHRLGRTSSAPEEGLYVLNWKPKYRAILFKII